MASESLASLRRNLVHARRVERDLDDELHSAFDLLVDEKIAAECPMNMPVAPRRWRSVASTL